MFAGFRSSNHPQQVNKCGALDDIDDRRTLPEVFNPLNDKYGPFTLDVAANARATDTMTKSRTALVRHGTVSFGAILLIQTSGLGLKRP